MLPRVLRAMVVPTGGAMKSSAFVERLGSRLRVMDTRVPADGARRAAVAALVHDAVTGPRVLLMRRTERAGDPWSGHVSLPGGRHEPSDADLLATAIRETHEELGVDLTGAHLLGSLEPLHPRSSGPAGIEVTPFVFTTTAVVEPRTGPEAAAAFWLPFDLATSGALDGTYTYPGSALTFPSWTYEGHTIWGLTMRILGSIAELSR